MLCACGVLSGRVCVFGCMFACVFEGISFHFVLPLCFVLLFGLLAGYSGFVILFCACDLQYLPLHIHSSLLYINFYGVAFNLLFLGSKSDL